MNPTVKIYPITPIGKPRMTQRDKWARRRVVANYHSFRDECRILGMTLPKCNYWIVCVIPMPASWSAKKRAAMFGKPHEQTPDKDNLEKAILNAVYGQDKSVWDGRVTKVWGVEGAIIVRDDHGQPGLSWLDGLV